MARAWPFACTHNSFLPSTQTRNAPNRSERFEQHRAPRMFPRMVINSLCTFNAVVAMSTQQTTPGSTGLTLERIERVKSELELILQSQAFKRSERHARFLRFVCDATLSGEASQLNEYRIAHQVFGRGSDYSPGEDSVVRRQAYTLRQKLQEYYGTEGRNDAVRIEIPIGRYVPTFKFPDLPTLPATASPVVEPVDEPSPAPVPAPPTTTFRPRGWVPWGAGALAVVIASLGAIVGWFAGSRNQHPPALDPIFNRIWGPLLSNSEVSVICFSNALTAGIRRTGEPFPGDSLTSGIMLSEPEADRVRKQFHLPAGGYFYINPGLAHAKMGEAMGSIALSAMFTKAGVPVRATQSRYLNWQDFRSQNLVLLGHDEANQWLDPILSKLPFRLARTTTLKPRRIVIADPRPGERSEYFPDYSKGLDPPSEDYALLSLLSGVDGNHGLALLNGVNTEDTLMAIDYLTEPVSLRALEATLRKANPGHSGPWHFQVILHSELRDGVPVGIELVTMRELH
jgi:hypothetical protein